MEKKNTILLTVIAVATLLVAVVGATFAYFTAANNPGTGANNEATVTTETVSAINVSSLADNTTYLSYPGGVSVFAAGVNISKTAASAGSTSTISYDVNLKYTNNTGTDLNYTIYTATEEQALALDADIDAGCTLQVTPSGGTNQYAYVCEQDAADFASLGTAGTTGKLTKNTAEEQTIQVADESITVNSEDAVNTSRYYYVVVDYPSTGDQTATDAGKQISLNIEVTQPTITTTAN
ncbi:MAG TPA: hypothetical protein IAB49_03525 [Candidatus Caccenecus avistercoris]|nr:hypothetical protein [Candidatus Caccenecus avistercoris]